jgi:hypothetical protein
MTDFETQLESLIVENGLVKIMESLRDIAFARWENGKGSYPDLELSITLSRALLNYERRFGVEHD